jgi:hypothetical protein
MAEASTSWPTGPVPRSGFRSRRPMLGRGKWSNSVGSRRPRPGRRGGPRDCGRGAALGFVLAGVFAALAASALWPLVTTRKALAMRRPRPGCPGREALSGRSAVVQARVATAGRCSSTGARCRGMRADSSRLSTGTRSPRGSAKLAEAAEVIESNPMSAAPTSRRSPRSARIGPAPVRHGARQ